MTLEGGFSDAGKDLEAAITKALKAGADLLLAKSNQLVPVESGELRRSGRAEAKGRKATVGYSSPYAVKQHEQLSFRHPRGQGKYLETAFRANMSSIEDAIAARLKAELE